MHHIDSPGSVAVLPTPAAAGTPGYWSRGNPANGTPATILDDDFFNAVMMELINIVTAGGLTPTKGDNDQVLTALQALFAAKAGSAAQTFSVAPSTSANHAVNQSQTFGVGQTRQVVTGSRALGTTYTNSTGKPITIHVSASGTAAGSALGFFTDAIEGAVSVATAAAGAIGISAVVAPGSTYAVIPSGGATLVAWVEYR